MPLPFALPTRPALPSLSSWTASPSPKTSDEAPHSAPERTSQLSFSSNKRLSAARSIASLRHTSLAVSRSTTPANPSPLSATFGLPGTEDDDPFGVLALEKAGLQIKEAGTRQRPPSEAFQYRPGPNSPIWRSSMASALSQGSSSLHRPSVDGRVSMMAGRPSISHSRQSSMSDVGTQTIALGRPDYESVLVMSPVDEQPSIRGGSSESMDPISPKTNVEISGKRPPPLKLRNNEAQFRDFTPSPKSRLLAVEEAAQEKASAGLAEEESELDRLAREIREMAEEHERENCNGGNMNSSANRVSQNEPSPEYEVPKSDEPVGRDRLSANIKMHCEHIAKHVGVAEWPAQLQHDENHEDEGDEADEDGDDEEYDLFDDEEPVIIEEAVQTAAPVTIRPRQMGAASLQARAQVVSIHLPPPPLVPVRNPKRPKQSSLEGETAIAEEEEAQRMSQIMSALLQPDNDSSSGYSVERDSFVDSYDDAHEFMTQTSHGSHASESPESTPTKIKMEDPVDHMGKVSQSLQSVDTAKEPSGQSQSAQSNHNDLENVLYTTDQSRQTLEQNQSLENEISTVRDEPKAEVKLTESISNGGVPDVPARRRPFSFELQPNEATFDKPETEIASQKSLVDFSLVTSAQTCRAYPRT